MNTGQLMALMPILMLSLTAVVLMIQASIKRDQGLAWWITAIGFLLTLWGAGYAREFTQPVTMLLMVDDWGLFFTTLILVASLVTLILSKDSFSPEGERKEEYYLLLVLSVLGAVVLIQSSHMASLLLGMELMGVALYGMIAFPEKGELPLEAAIKYLVLSACASAMLLFGFALIYAATGDLSYGGMGAKAAAAFSQEPLVLMAGSAMVLAGLGFKLSVVPFHMWTPDVYQGAPTPVTGFLATVSKGAVFVALTRFYLDGQLYQYDSLIMALSVVAMASMLVGNWLALRQDNIKRLLAYSSIAHFGYLLIVLIALAAAQSTMSSELIGQAITFYLAAYIVTTLAAFTVIANLAGEDDSKSMLSAFEGLFWRNPVQASALTVAMLSFAGIPLTAGFIGKFYLIMLSIQSQLWVLLGALVLGSAIAIYYYLRIIFAMSKTSGTMIKTESRAALGAQDIVAALLLLLVLALGSWPQPFIEFAGAL
ncbi:NADH-quinone oxidoreductase subunit N [SAR92 clade bacterium H231]|jgi:NADH-quinone oxidoreductase subunit N|nr:NADH-quinone oxidoreductase subunit N [Porticoccaceae bacterium]MCT2534016.1 NADH-quinone oxidoreductase subunit N [SAR92 clade bacterium H231]MDA8978642.1 NADH-quinone oxidoreductase subunit N [bacterium]MBT6320195.1 NADH-quinone oxidoreductase subunit N [Porticoccaceae bacterium]MBT7258997.1 NADH-quinone oxidoreductase subunit N [Porticoccaceae bacterium]